MSSAAAASRCAALAAVTTVGAAAAESARTKSTKELSAGGERAKETVVAMTQLDSLVERGNQSGREKSRKRVWAGFGRLVALADASRQLPMV